MSAKVTRDEAILAQGFFEQLYVVDPFTYPTFPVEVVAQQGIQDVRTTITEIYQGAASRINTVETRTTPSEPQSVEFDDVSQPPMPTTTDPKNTTSSKELVDRNISLRKPNILIRSKRIKDIRNRAIAPNTTVKKALVKVKKDYDEATYNTMDTRRKSKQYKNILKTIEEALKISDIQVLDKAALILKKAQILTKTGGDSQKIAKMIDTILDEIGAATLKRVPWQSIIYPLNEMLATIEKEHESKA